MLRRRSRLDRLLLSPTFNIVVAIAAAAVIFFNGGDARFVTLGASIAIGALSVALIRSRELFKASPWPFLAIFMLFQALFPLSWAGSATLLFAFGSLFVVFLNHLQPRHSRVAYTLSLPVAFVALFCPSVLLWVPILAGILIGMHAFSFRSLLALLLSITTPWIIYPVLALLTLRFELIDEMLERYSAPIFTFDPLLGLAYYVPATLILLGFLFTFLISYGYPAVMRAHNMTLYILSGGALLAPIFDPLGLTLWHPLINFCAAYMWAHLVAVSRIGRPVYLLLLAAAITGLCTL